MQKKRKNKMKNIEATITESGNGSPAVGSLVYDSESNSVYRVLATGRIETGRSPGAGNWMLATLEDAGDPSDYTDEEWDAVADCRVNVAE